MGATLNNIKTTILDAMATYGGLSNDDMASKWICLGCNDDLMLEGVQVGVITQIWEQLAPYLHGVHCVAH